MRGSFCVNRRKAEKKRGENADGANFLLGAGTGSYNPGMKTELFDYELPAELIAQHPAAQRSGSRMLVVERATNRWSDGQFAEIGQWLRAGDCLVLNDTRVVAARFMAKRATGGRIEGLFLEEEEVGVWVAMLKNAGKVKAGEDLTLLGRDTSEYCRVRAVRLLGEGRWRLEVDSELPAFQVLEAIGTPPLPPYIRRERPDEDRHIEADMERYQTVYAKEPGAIAAPTAGLHFTTELMDELAGKGVGFARLTLHVGAGTFKPVTAETLDEHRMHSEEYSLDEQNADIINAARAAGGRIVAVGTTTVRTLETVARSGQIAAAAGSTDIFIKPGYKFRAVDAMVTNFHLPKSTLIALVAALAGYDMTMAAYRHAVENRYRFYSYGDSMLIV
jgi:S-adenosylmethionine:tRNA ribosyltransferase-isomerase